MPTGDFSAQLAAILANKKKGDAASFAGTRINPLPPTPTMQLGATSPVGGRPNDLLAGTLNAIHNANAPQTPGNIGLDPNIGNKLMQLQSARTDLGQPPQGHHGTSLLGHVFDFLGKGVNTVAGATEGAIDAAKHNSNPLSSIVHGVGGAFQGGEQGLTGSGKYAHQDWGDVLRHEGVHNGVLDGVLGTVGDIVLDPLNLTGIGEIGKVADIAKGGAHLLDGIKGLSAEEKAAALGHSVIDDVVHKASIPNEPIRVDPAQISAARVASDQLLRRAATELPKSKQASFMQQASGAFEHNMKSLQDGVKSYRGLRVGKSVAPVYRMNTDLAQRVKNLARPVESQITSIPENVPAKLADKMIHSNIEQTTAAKEARHGTKFFGSGFSRIFTKPTSALGGGEIARHLTDAWGASHNRISDVRNAISSHFKDIKPEHDQQMLQDYARQSTPDFLRGSRYLSEDGSKDYSSELAHAIPKMHDTLVRPVFNPKTTNGYQLLNKYLPRHGLKTFSYSDMKDAAHFENAAKQAFGALPKHAGATDALSRLQTGMEKAAMEHHMFTNLGDTHGMRLHYDRPVGKPKGKLTLRKDPLLQKRIDAGWRPVNHPSLHGPTGPTHLFPPEIASQMEGLSHFLANPPARTLPKDFDANKFVRKTDQFLNHYKTATTVINPGSHGRYIIGSAIQSFINGMENPAHFFHGAKVALSRDPELRHVAPEDVLNPQMRSFLQQGGTRGGKVVYHSKRLGRDLTDREIYDQASHRGVLHNFVRENLQGTNKVYKVLDKIGDKRDNIPRLGFFIDRIEHAPPQLKSEKEIMDWAAQKTISAHHNFGDMSNFEKNVLQRVMPFYADIRKNTPMVLKLLFQNPGRIASYPLALQELTEATHGHDWSKDPNFRDISPSYLFDRGAVPVGAHGNNPVFLDQKNHVADVLFQLAGAHTLGGEPAYVGRQLGSSLNPLLRIPLEEMARRQLYSGNPINKQSDYFLRQSPITDAVYKAIENSKASAASGNTGGPSIPIAVANELAGVGLTEDTPRQQLSAVLSKLNSAKKQVRAQQGGFRAP